MDKEQRLAEIESYVYAASECRGDDALWIISELRKAWRDSDLATQNAFSFHHSLMERNFQLEQSQKRERVLMEALEEARHILNSPLLDAQVQALDKIDEVMDKVKEMQG